LSEVVIKFILNIRHEEHISTMAVTDTDTNIMQKVAFLGKVCIIKTNEGNKRPM
jgi:hypothetical protein